MKKILLIIVTSLGITSCGINCSGEPPKRANYNNEYRYDMKYHAIIYLPYASLSHSIKCSEYEYIPIHLFFDEFGEINGNSIIWKTYDLSEDMPFEENGENIDNIIAILNKNSITLSGFISGYKSMNGKYKIETTSPDSWGIPYDGDGK